MTFTPIPHTVNQKYRGYVQPQNQNVFSIIDSRLTQIMPDWTTKVILDFGCNVGHLLRTAGDRIPHENFHGVDINAGSIMIARHSFPNAHWSHYDGFNPTFNPTGQKTARPNISISPDVIIAYGVFTHSCFSDIQRWIGYFKTIIARGGVIVFSIWETEQFLGYLWFLYHSFGVRPPIKNFIHEKYFYLLNRDHVLTDQPTLPLNRYDWIETFYNRDFILNAVTGSRVLHGETSHHTVYAITQ